MYMFLEIPYYGLPPPGISHTLSSDLVPQETCELLIFFEKRKKLHKF